MGKFPYFFVIWIKIVDDLTIAHCAPERSSSPRSCRRRRCSRTTSPSEGWSAVRQGDNGDAVVGGLRAKTAGKTSCFWKKKKGEREDTFLEDHSMRNVSGGLESKKLDRYCSRNITQYPEYQPISEYHPIWKIVDGTSHFWNKFHRR